ncbi:hypothetical protein DFH08DRAFT_249935, partial [Mycena albidolilacea]
LSVQDGWAIWRRLRDASHIASKTCACLTCTDDRRMLGCENPHSCAKAVETRFNSFLPKWDPRLATSADDEEGKENRGDSGVSFVGPKRIKTLTEGFRVFTKHSAVPEQEVCHARREPPTHDLLPIKVWISGATKRNNEGVDRAGAGVWFGQADPRNQSILIPTTTGQTVSNSETIAAILALLEVGPMADIEITSSRHFIQKAMTQQLAKWEDNGWISVPDRLPLQVLAAELKQRTGKTTLGITDEESDSTAKAAAEKASRLVREGCRNQSEVEIPLQVAPEMVLRGAKLSTLTQAVMYAGIKEL